MSATANPSSGDYNTANNSNAANAPHDVQEWARLYLRRGYYPVPIPRRLKKPVLDGWNDLRVTEQDIPRCFEPEANVGLKLGDSRLVDIDLDCTEARDVADYFLPPTGLVLGRASSIRSHRLYALPDSGDLSPLAYAKFVDPIEAGAGGHSPADDHRGTIVELRTGRVNGRGEHQVVVPPSVHPSGERYSWQSFGEPEIADPRELSVYVRHLAAAALLTRNWPRHDSNRHELALALAGGLLRARGRFSSEYVGFLIEVVARVAGDDEVADRAKAAEYTAARLHAGERATGWPTFAEGLGANGQVVVRCVREWLELDSGQGQGQEQGPGSGQEDRPGRGPTQASRLVAMADRAGV